MAERINRMVQAVQSSLGGVRRNGAMLAALGLGATASYMLYAHPPLAKLTAGSVGIRTNQLTGSAILVHDGAVFMMPGVHVMRELSLLDQVYRPARAEQAPFQSVEGLALGVDMSVRYALDPARVAAMAQSLPPDIKGSIVEPAVQGVIYKVFTRYTVREIYSSKRAEIQKEIETELKPKLAADGVTLRGITIGKISLPEEYQAGMEKLLAEELETEKMRYTLELKEKQVKQTALEADAEKVRREKAAEAAGNEQIIAARAQEQAMAHVLPFKQKQIEQRKLEAEAEKEARIKTSEGNAQARLIEAVGEADSRRKLAEAEAYRQEIVGKVAAAQMEREGDLLTRNPLLIQKTMADKLSDKVSVIIAPPPSDGGFIGSSLLGKQPRVAHASATSEGQ
ncbi:prohibitin family protein [Duganella sp. FT135W]|uniref:Prohibitin family protein n=1 Tax=Duganella flavida TaxID=2692175 RepID=A0A6L8KHS2_9BURK|nr:SPFH domain-containing protein [Duganella flavida]MYM26665.1 prohibitin family protein [Duganella flavida]